MSLTVVWPSGQKDTIPGIKPDQSIIVQEGKGILNAHAIAFSH